MLRLGAEVRGSVRWILFLSVTGTSVKGRDVPSRIPPRKPTPVAERRPHSPETFLRVEAAPLLESRNLSNFQCCL